MPSPLPENLPAEDGLLLILAASGRSLAASARRAGFRPLVLDAFGDADLAELALSERVGVDEHLGFEADALAAALERMVPADAVADVVAGSGFEDRPALLARLARRHRLWGNVPATVARAKDPAQFFPLLDRLGIPHPQVSLVPPIGEGWLEKRIGGSGGHHVRPAAPPALQPDSPHCCYWQRRGEGRSMSALFLADGRRARVVGISQHLERGGAHGYGWRGAIGDIELPQGLARTLAAELEALTEALGLVGLNGIDFLLDGPRHAVLEVNPRPTATVELYDRAGAHLFAWHLAACRGELPSALPREPGHHGLAVVYARNPVAIPAGMAWPAWCVDRPRDGSLVATGAPLCTVLARGVSPVETARLLTERETAVLNHLTHLDPLDRAAA